VQVASSSDGSQAGGTAEVQVGRGTRLAAVQRVEIPGPLEETGRPLDFAIEGDGYFQVALPDGTLAYTRDGSFTISESGALVTNGGYAVAPGITIPDDAVDLSVSRSGIVSVRTPSAAETVEIGRLELARFANSPGLRALGENLYAETSASGVPQTGFPQERGFGRVVQGSLEASNVEIVQEMVEMITAMRAYEINSKAVQSAEQMAETANNLLR
ncbi:MAG: flagellar basal-body rod protein FlgG, partial [Gemmatimonadetes bacterium]|nr:flagellar basal-body rod protein FlgG [Gemmatimonadota bacterium]